MERRKTSIFGKVVLVLLVLAVFAVFYIPRNYMIEMPGNTEPVKNVIQVEGGHKSESEIRLVAVSSRDADPISLLRSFWDPNIQIANKEDVIPEGWTYDEYNNYLVARMEESQVMAQYVAFDTLNMDVKMKGEGVEVISFMENSPAKDKLKENDLIVGVDGKEITVSQELIDIVSNKTPGEDVEFMVVRDGQNENITVTTMESDETPGKSVVGVYIVTRSLSYEFPKKVTFDMSKYGGPSGGAAMTLEIINQLTDRDIAGGKKIAVTGTVDMDGKVGAIGGVDLKIAAAKRDGMDLFFCPEENKDLALKAGEREGIKVIPVEHISEIMEYLSQN